MPSFQAEYVSAEILDLIKKDLAERGYQPSDTHITLTGGNLDNLKISMTINPLPQPATVTAAPAPQQAKPEKSGKGKYYKSVSELTPEEKEARRAEWRAKSQAQRDAAKAAQQKEAEAQVKAQAEANELEDIRMKSEMEVVAPSNPPFQQSQPEIKKRIPAGTPVLPQTGIKYRGYPVEAAAD